MSDHDETQKNERSQRIITIMSHLSDVLQTATPEQRATLQTVASLMQTLDDDTPMTKFREVSVEELRNRGAAPLRRMMSSPLDYLRQLFHGSTSLRPGEQWTISVGIDCGFAMDFTVRMKALGDCQPSDEFLKGEGTPAEEPPADTADTKPAPPDDQFDTLLQSLGLRSPEPTEKPKRPRRPRVKPEKPVDPPQE